MEVRKHWTVKEEHYKIFNEGLDRVMDLYFLAVNSPLSHDELLAEELINFIDSCHFIVFYHEQDYKQLDMLLKRYKETIERNKTNLNKFDIFKFIGKMASILDHDEYYYMKDCRSKKP